MTAVVKEFVEHGVAVELSEGTVNVADGVIEFLEVADDDLEGRREFEMRLVTEVKGEAVDVLDG